MLRPHPHKTFIYHLLELDRKRNISYLDRSAVANAGKFSTIRSLRRLSLWPASTSISFTLPSLFNLSQWDPRGVAFNRLGSHTNNLLTFLVFFGRGGDPDLSLSSSELLLAFTPFAIASWMLTNAWSGRICISHYTRSVGTKGFKFHNDVLKIKRFALLHFSNGKEHCMYSFKMFFC